MPLYETLHADFDYDLGMSSPAPRLAACHSNPPSAYQQQKSPTSRQGSGTVVARFSR
jgi:hypothetical protein